MDWSAVATSLAESSALPIVALDLEGRILLFNSAFEQLTGWQRSEILGAGWVDTFVLPERGPLARARLSDAIRGALRKYDCEVVTRDRRGLRLSFELFRVGCADDGALIASVTTSVALTPAVPSGRDLDYEISSDLVEFGTVRKLSLMGAERTEVIGQKCYRALHGRESACAGCLVRAAEAHDWPRTMIREAEGAFEIVTGVTTSTGTVRISVRSLPHHTLSRMLQARIAHIGDDAGLSEREQAVLTYLLMGRSLEDIATILGIRARTVKFHQANILEKLGADSRFDLMRLIF